MMSLSCWETPRDEQPDGVLRVSWIGRKVNASFRAEKEMAKQLLRFLVITWILILKFCLRQKSGFGQGGFLSREEFLPSGIPTPASCLDDDHFYGRKMSGIVPRAS